MKNVGTALLFSVWTLGGLAQDGSNGNLTNTLLWKISGNGLSKPSYLYGTIHMICASDAIMSENLSKAITSADEVYFELDLDNIVEMLQAVSKMKMNGDTTLKDLLEQNDYELVKAYFDSIPTEIPFAMLETFKPILTVPIIQEKSLDCETMTTMEQFIMEKAKKSDKRIRGLETMAYQAGVLDSIPYKLQAEQLLDYVRKSRRKETDDSELREMMEAYKAQDLNKLEQLMLKNDMGVANFTEILLYRRNRNWVESLKSILQEKSVLIAVGAGHLPGEEGMINLLKKAGYVVEPVENKVGREI